MEIDNRILKTIQYTDAERSKAEIRCKRFIRSGWGWVCGGIDEHGLWGDYDPYTGLHIVQLDRVVLGRESLTNR